MKWIGQHIWDFISRFRGEVYIENLSTTTETNVLVVDSAGKVSKNTTTVGGDITGVTAGDALTGGGTSGALTINHEDTSSQASVNNSGSTYVQDVTLDTYGHVTGLTSAAIPTLNQNTSGTAAGLSSTLAVGSGGTGLTTVATDTILTGNGTGALTAEASLKYTGSTGVLSAGLTNAKVEVGRVRASSDSPSLLTTSSGSSVEIDTFHLFGTTVPTVVKFMPSGEGQQAQVIIEGPEANGTDVAGTDMWFVPGAGTGDEPSGSFKFYGHAGGGASDADVNVPTAMVTIGPQGNITTLGNLVVTGTPIVGWHGSHTTIKILHSDFSADDGGRPFMIDDTGVGSENLFGKTHSTMFAYATVAIPTGYKATHVMVYGDGARAVEVWEHQINSKTGVSKGTGNVDTEINITDVNSSATNYLFIQVAQTAVDEIHGGYVTIATI
tara:strand:- start:1575 stop:2891 length:1317 start_codon:yes stop_codon:yes gene_type:complete